MSYLKYEVRIEEEDMKEFLSNFYDEEEIERMDLLNEGQESLNGILQDHFSDYCVITRNTLLVGDWE